MCVCVCVCVCACGCGCVGVFVGVCVCGCGMLICFVSALGSHEMGRHKLPIIIIIIIVYSPVSPKEVDHRGHEAICDP